jgi:hypothetical protein
MKNYSTTASIEEFLFSKFQTIDELISVLETDACLLSDSIESFMLKTGFATDRFTEAYALAVQITIETLQKPHLRGVCRFRKLPVDRAVKWLKSRIINNIKNVLTDHRLTYYMGKQSEYEDHDTASYHYSTDHTEQEAELDDMEKEVIKDGLINMWKNGEDIDDIRYLASKYGVDINFLGECVISRNNNAQLTFDF